MSLSQAYARLQAGDLTGAETLLTALLENDARNTDALHMRAIARHQRGDLAGALADLDTILEYPPDHADTRFNRGAILLQMKRYEDALRDLERATELAPQDVAIWLNRAAAERAMNRDDAAVESYAAGLRLDPRQAGAASDLAASLARLGRFDEALSSLDAALAIDGENAGALANRGKVLTELERYEDARISFEASLRIDPGRGGVWNDFAGVLAVLGRDTEACAAFDRAASVGAREFSAGHPLYNKSLLHLSRGEYGEGFTLFAKRAALGVIIRPAGADTLPEWNGAPLGGALRIWSEQGVGDQVLFTRLLPLVLQRAPNVVLDCDARLAPLLQRAHPSLAIVARDAPFDGAVAQIAMGDLPRVLGVEPADVAKLPAILRPDTERAAALRARYEALAQGKPIIGVAWTSPRAKTGRLKSAGLAHWGALLREPYFFVSLQYDIARDIVEASAPILVDETIDQMRSLKDFAAQIAALDAVISISNTTVHIAGALGKPAVVLVPPARGLLWYWGFKGETSPWYASVRLVRRAIGAPWDGQVAAGAALLGAMLGR